MKKILLKVLMAAVGVVAVIGGFLFFKNEGKKQLTEAEMSRNELQKDSTQGIIPPLPTKDNEFREFTVNAERDTVIVYETGTLINIPKNAFVYPNGDSVKGSVDIVYREFHSMGEILLSGINMRYDSAGVEQYFESAGMFEINGSKDNKDILIRKESPVQVSLASFNNSDDEFGQYKLNKASNTWDYIKPDKQTSMNIDDSLKKERKLRKELKELKMDPIYTFSISAKEFPHLKQYEDMIFKVSPKTKDYSTSNGCWINCKVQETKVKGEYRIVFKAAKDSMVIFATNFSDSKEFEERLAKYEKEAEKIMEKLGLKYKREVDEFATKMELYLNAIGQYDKARIKYMELMRVENELKKGETDLKTSDPYYNDKIVSSVFSVNGFGIYNSDQTHRLPNGQTVELSFFDKSSKKLEVSKAYFVEKGTKTTYYIYQNKLTFDPQKENVILLITKNQEIALVGSETFKSIARGEKKATFTVDPKKSGTYTALDINDMIYN